MARTPAPVLFAVVAVVALAACSGGDDEAAPTPPPVAAPTVASAVPSVTVTETVPLPTATPVPPPTTTPEAEPAAPEGCPSTGQPAPEQAGGELVGDLDGDGASDRVVLNGGVLTFATASGLVTDLDLGVPPSWRALAVADPQQDGQTFVFVAAYPRDRIDESDADIRLATLVDCQPVLVTDADGETYVIEYRAEGGDSGRGFGCSDANGDGDRELVGLVQQTQGALGTDAGTDFQRTIIALDGRTATSGETDEGFIDPGQPAPLASCGNEVYELG